MTQEEKDGSIRKEKERLSELPYFEMDPCDRGCAVLLGNRVKSYSDRFRLIDPLEPNNLRPAGYDLRVGDNYTEHGQEFTLNSGGSMTIKPFEVAIIQTLETLNIPDFLIGRWNIRVGLAYKGLQWVGGAQVDPGFRGRLSCPIYNLSTEDVTLKHGEELAMIDFVTTTPFVVTETPGDGGSRAFQWWWKKKKLVFQEYNTRLRSGVEKSLDDQKKRISAVESTTEQRVKEVELRASDKTDTINQRIDTFVVLLFTVIAVLFAALGIVATKGTEEPSFITSPVWIAAVALYFALRSYLRSPDRSRDTIRGLWVLELFAGSLIVVASLAVHVWSARVASQDIRQAQQQAAQALRAADAERGSVATEIQLRKQADARIESLQQQVNTVLQNQSGRR